MDNESPPKTITALPLTSVGFGSDTQGKKNMIALRENMIANMDYLKTGRCRQRQGNCS